MTTQPNLNAEAELHKFVGSLVAEKKFDVEPEILEQIKEDVFERAENIINATIVAETPANKLEELNQLLDAHDQPGIDNFCDTNVPDLQQKIADALVRFRKTYLGLK